MRERVVSAGAADTRSTDHAGLPSIRLRSNETRPLLERFLRFLRYNPETPQEQVIPWWATLFIGLAMAVLQGFVVGPLLGSRVAPFTAVLTGSVVRASSLATQPLCRRHSCRSPTHRDDMHRRPAGRRGDALRGGGMPNPLR